METAKNTINYVSESIQGAGKGAEKRANTEVAKDSDASLGNRATAAKDALGAKVDESSHNAKADVNKEAAKH